MPYCAIVLVVNKPRDRKHSYPQRPYIPDKEAHILYMKHLESSCNNQPTK